MYLLMSPTRNRGTLLALHSPSGGVEEEEEIPGPGEPSEGHRVPIARGVGGCRRAMGTHTPPPHSPGSARASQEVAGPHQPRDPLVPTPPAPVLPGLQLFNPLSARALPREMSRELGRYWVSPNWGRTPQTLGSPAALCQRNGIFQAIHSRLVMALPAVTVA